MAKKPVSFAGMVDTESLPANTGIPQRGAELGSPARKAKRDGEKRLTLALDGEAYRRLRIHAAETGQTHQAILEAALNDYLQKVST